MISLPIASSRARNLSQSSGVIPSSGKSIDVGDKIDNRIANLPNLPTKPALELFGGGSKREIGLGPNQIDDGLGLGQVHLAVQECALGEFAAARAARPRAQAGFEHARGDEGAAVTTDLNQIFARVTDGRAVDRHHDLVDQVAGVIDDLAKVLELRRQFGGFVFF